LEFRNSKFDIDPHKLQQAPFPVAIDEKTNVWIEETNKKSPFINLWLCVNTKNGRAIITFVVEVK
jgi:hypothetical protein